MRSIKTITLKNFQSHKDTTINLDDNINIISGESNNGKSAILRGVLWLITNRPQGIGMVSNWAKECNRKGEIVLKKDAVCSVTIVCTADDGTEHTISRLRSRDKNIYVIDGIELEAIGTSVPKNVTDILSMHECNIQSQDDPYFMLTLSPGQVASKLNELVHLDSIDTAYTYNKNMKHIASTLYKEWCSLAAEQKLKLDGLKHIKELSAQAEELVVMQEECCKLKDSVEGMEEYRDKLYEYKKALEHSVPDLSDTIERCADLIDDYNDACNLVGMLQGSLDNLSKIQDELSITCNVTDSDITGLDALIKEYNKLLEEEGSIRMLLGKYKLNASELLEKAKDIAALEKELPDTCPTCGHPLDMETL